jgi:TctA family transporter
MEMFQNILNGFSISITPMSLEMCLVGCFVGNLIGVLLGIGKDVMTFTCNVEYYRAHGVISQV